MISEILPSEVLNSIITVTGRYLLRHVVENRGGQTTLSHKSYEEWEGVTSDQTLLGLV